jgi:hypothetical protein
MPHVLHHIDGNANNNNLAKKPKSMAQQNTEAAMKDLMQLMAEQKPKKWDGTTWPPPDDAETMEVLETLWSRLKISEKFIQDLHAQLISMKDMVSSIKTAHNVHLHTMPTPVHMDPPPQPTGEPTFKC